MAYFENIWKLADYVPAMTYFESYKCYVYSFYIWT